jgi:CRP-like cAMP-binding protein
MIAMPGPLIENRLLGSLPAIERGALLPQLEKVLLSARAVVSKEAAALTQVYFPETCILSVLAVIERGAAVEVTTVGSEGFTGLQLVFGGIAAPTRTVCQIPGAAWRIAARDFKAFLRDAPVFRRLAETYAEALFNCMGQSILCNRLHTLSQRCARWLLMAHDRIGDDEFELTQEMLATTLGVRRPGVSIAAAALAEGGGIRYRRGRVQILDRSALEKASCECYTFAARQFATLLQR